MSRFYNLDQVPFNSRSAARAIAAANNGLLFDIGDMSTLFQDAAGTVPVTAVEQPVGKIIDKSGNGNHATQSITASRPTLSARYNLLTKTENFADAVWIKTGCDTSPTADGTKITLTGVAQSNILQNLTVSIGALSTLSIKIKSDTVSTVSLRILRGPTVIKSVDNIPISKEFSTISIGNDVGFDGTNATVAIYPGNRLSQSIGQSVIVKRVQLEYGPTATTYQKVNTATDYDTDPRYFPKYLRFDGVDDYLNLPYMGLYAGGEMSIIAARNAVSQATDTYIISERSTTNANPKYFPSRQLASGGNMDSYISDDTAAVVLDTIGSAFSGASDKVIRSVVDTGNNIKLFKNGALAANDNYTRAGTLTLNNTTIGVSVSTTTGNYASMKLYGLIITKSALTDAQRVRCERFLARKAGVML